MFRLAKLIGVATVLFGWFAGDRAGALVPLEQKEAAAVVINLADLLANEPALPLPVRQRHDALNAYYQEEAGPLLWVGSDRMVALVDRLSIADVDGLDHAADYDVLPVMVQLQWRGAQGPSQLEFRTILGDY